MFHGLQMWPAAMVLLLLVMTYERNVYLQARLSGAPQRVRGRVSNGWHAGYVFNSQPEEEGAFILLLFFFVVWDRFKQLLG